MAHIDDRPEDEEIPPPFGSELLASLSGLINRWISHRFQTIHATRLHNDLGFGMNKVLYVLGSTGACRPSTVAEQLGTGRANVSKLIARLEAQHLVTRMPDPGDSRASLIALTPLGRERSRDVFEIGDRMLQEMTAAWTDAEFETFTRLMTRLNVAAAEYEQRVAASAPRRPGPGEGEACPV